MHNRIGTRWERSTRHDLRRRPRLQRRALAASGNNLFDNLKLHAALLHIR